MRSAREEDSRDGDTVPRDGAPEGGAFAGVLISPVHLCLALTREYFQAQWGRVYRSLIPLTAAIVLASIVIALVT